MDRPNLEIICFAENRDTKLTGLLSLRSFLKECSPHMGQILRIIMYFVCIAALSPSDEIKDDFDDEPFGAGLHRRTIECLRQYPFLSNLAPS